MQVTRAAERAARDVPHRINAVLRQPFRIPRPHPPKICNRAMGPQELPVAQLIQPRDADTVFIRSDMFGDDVQRSFAEVEVGTDPRGGGNSSGVKYIFDHPLCEFPRGQAGSLKIGRDVHEHLVDGIGVDIFRRHMAEVHLIYAGAPLHVTGHARRGHDIIQLQRRGGSQLQIIAGGTGKDVAGSPLPTMSVDLPDLLDYFKEPGPSRNSIRFQRRRDGQTDGFLRAGQICYHKVGGHGVQPPAPRTPPRRRSSSDPPRDMFLLP